MSRSTKRQKGPGKKASEPKAPAKGMPWGLVVGVIGVVAIIASAAAWLKRDSGAKLSDAKTAYAPRPQGTVTFNKEIAPIIYHSCAPCHRPDQSGPFNLLAYKDVRAHGETISKVVEKRYMPPWLPDPDYSHFADERVLNAQEIGLIQQWVRDGMPEGQASDLPPAPHWPDGWELGKPDLIVTLPSSYTLGAEGRDVYRNFIVPIPTTERRYVRAVEFHPSNKVVHHAFIDVDATRQSRFLADHGTPPGFDGMELPDSVQMPSGQMLGWQPGKPPLKSPEGLAWVLEPNADMVLQLHLHPSGKPESVLPAVGFYFTDRTPTNTPFRVNITRHLIDIPAGATNYSIENTFTLPVDVDVLRINPHTHYLGKRLEGFAIRPDGTKQGLLLIHNWDFDWQADYRYEQPVFLPKGTTIQMHFTYDNSTNNIHNPNNPPKRVQFGLQTQDEMGELWLQVLARSPADREILAKNVFYKTAQDAIEENEQRLKSNPQDALAHARLGTALFVLGKSSEAIPHLRAAVQLNPNDAKAHYQLGDVYLRANMLADAKVEFQAVARLAPNDFQAQGNLGFIALREKNLDQAAYYFENALRLNPNDPAARSYLEKIRSVKRKE